MIWKRCKKKENIVVSFVYWIYTWMRPMFAQSVIHLTLSVLYQPLSIHIYRMEYEANNKKIFPKIDIQTTLSIFSEAICLNQYKWNTVIFGNSNVIQCGTVGISLRACVCVELPICIIAPQLRFLAECPKFPNYHNCAKILNYQKNQFSISIKAQVDRNQSRYR